MEVGLIGATGVIAAKPVEGVAISEDVTVTILFRDTMEGTAKEMTKSTEYVMTSFVQYMVAGVPGQNGANV